MEKLVQNGEDLTIVGIVQPAEGANAAMLSPGINYPAALTAHCMEQAAASPIVRDQLADAGVNVFTGDRFGEESEEDRFDLEDLFTVDADLLESAFTLDTDALSIDTDGLFDFSSLTLDPSVFAGLDLSGLDLSGMDLSGLDLSGLDLSGLDLSGLDLSGLDWGALLGEIEFTATPEQLAELAQQMLEGYAAYYGDDPKADFSRLGEYFVGYLKTDEAKALLAQELERIVQDSGIALSAEQVKQLVVTVMSGYQEWAAAMGYTDPAQFDVYLAEYLETEQAKQLIAEGSAAVLASVEAIEITPEQVEGLAQALLEGTVRALRANGLADPTTIGDYFLTYLKTPEAEAMLAAALDEMVDTSGVTELLNAQMAEMQQAIGAAIQQAMQPALEQVMNQVMQQVMTTLTGQVMPAVMTQVMTGFGQAIGAQIETGMQQVMAQLSDALQNDSRALRRFCRRHPGQHDRGRAQRAAHVADDGPTQPTYEGNLRALGYADAAEPSSISIYPRDFESKEQVLAILDGYNERMEQTGQEEKVIAYTDIVGTLMSSVTDIINVISYVLVAFVAISLIVSSIMIGVITYISVLERKKEIGILRAIGASKGNVSQVFNAETFMIGLCAGLIGIGLTLLLLIPGQRRHPQHCRDRRRQRRAAGRGGRRARRAQRRAHAHRRAASLAQGR